MKYLAVLLLALCFGAHAEDSIKARNAAIAASLSRLGPEFEKIDEISKSPIPGMYEVRSGANLVYTNATGKIILQGHIIDVDSRTDLTQARLDEINKIDFSKLPIKDAIKIVRGDGSRKVAVFVDPNCGYCKKFEADLRTVDNLTVYVFLYPILGQDSNDKSRDIWCAADKGKTWLDWMLSNVKPPQATCDVAALGRNLQYGRTAAVNGTPAMFFTDGSRAPGAISAEAINGRLAAIK